MAAVKAERAQVSRCWHPEAPIELIDLGRDLRARVLVGEPAYQLSSGEIIKVS
ncbi:MAG TPA: hypothetical protein VF472_21810 [Burkholderiaceae bacterium]